MILYRKHFALLLLFLDLAKFTYSQVTIGLGSKPSRAAILDLKTQEPDNENVTSTKGGLVLTRVLLVNLNTLEPFITITDKEWINTNERTQLKKVHKGLVVYNLTQNSSFREGLYTWDGEKWIASSEINANNGLTKLQNTIELGGMLNKNTVITGSNTATFTIAAPTTISEKLSVTGQSKLKGPISVGSNEVNDNPAAALQIKTQNADNANVTAKLNGGFGLPRVQINNADNLLPLLANATTQEKSAAMGTMVYNVGGGTENLEAGVYTWNGKLWMKNISTLPVSQANFYELKNESATCIGWNTMSAKSNLMDFGTIAINDPGNYALLLKIYGNMTDKCWTLEEYNTVFPSASSAPNCDNHKKIPRNIAFYIWIFKNGTLVDCAELNAIKVNEGKQSVAMTSVFSINNCALNDVITLRVSMYAEHFAEIKFGTSSSSINAAKTSLITWKL